MCLFKWKRQIEEYEQEIDRLRRKLREAESAFSNQTIKEFELQAKHNKEVLKLTEELSVYKKHFDMGDEPTLETRIEILKDIEVTKALHEADRYRSLWMQYANELKIGYSAFYNMQSQHPAFLPMW